ncbi:phytanoyl-CoA dioxygenase family protein [Kriegella aquimaris]|uniref:Phytanoyl-CoA dioxygenase (PhyH) n=1 Tax=Kriegella aquimaris TaxID=192904 RepID=A0A1G9VCZ7_9FLAO|nr:phytanoyl-CoA dioxygenase family protein [Kriegella aquimaris]SDM70072.1 Phytanoyl-CoA dioxygenase (PhyH) [Kriegella aquimaris]
MEELFNYRKLTTKELQQYHDQGFLNIGSTLTNKGLERLTKESMEAWHSEKREFKDSATWLQNSLLVDIHKKSHVAKSFYFNGPLVDIMEQIIGSNIKGATSQLTFKMKGNTKAFGWHQDNGYGELDPYNAVTTLTALDDTDEENGCLRIIPGSHKMGQIDVSNIINSTTKKKQVSIDLKVDESLAIPARMKAGETLIFNSFFLHQSQGNFSKHRDRRILFLRYADADAVEVYNERKPRLGKLLRGQTRFPEVASYEEEL